jgi:hypothetical protein
MYHRTAENELNGFFIPHEIYTRFIKSFICGQIIVNNNNNNNNNNNTAV